MMNRFIQLIIWVFFVLQLSLMAHAKELDIREETTPSGLKFYYVKSDAQDIAVISFAFPGGTAHDMMEGPMTTFLAGNLMMQSAGGVKIGELKEDLNDIGGAIVIQPDAEYILGAAIAPTAKLGDVAKMANRILTRPDFPDYKLENLKKDAAQNYTVYRNQQVGKATLNFVSALSKPHPYSTNYLGDPARVHLVKRDGLLKWHKNRIVRKGLIITVVGNLAKDEMAKSVDVLFAGLPAQGKLPELPDIVTSKALSKPIHLEGKNKQALIIIGGLSVSAKDPKTWSAVVMLRNILAFGQNSRLFKSIREETGKTYGMRAMLTPFSKIGTLSISGFVDKEGLSKTVTNILETISKFRKEGPTDKEIAQQIVYFENLDAKMLKNHPSLSGILNKFIRYGWTLNDLRQFSDINKTIDLKDPKYRELLLPKNLIVLVAE